MSKVLIVAELSGTTLNQSTAKCVSCGGQLDETGVDIVVFSNDCSGPAAEAAALNRVSKVLTVENDYHAGPLAALIAPELAVLAENYEYVLGPSTTFGKDLMPRVAALLDVGQVSDIMAVESPRSFQRPIYAGNAIITVEVPAGRKIVGTVRVASYPTTGSGGAATIEPAAPGAKLPQHTRYVELTSGTGERPDLQSARIVLSGGRGLGSEQNFEQLYRLADKLGAAVGASRAAVDAGYVPNDMQVGQTGKIIAPELYIAFGISGAIQHLTGIKDAGTIVAINKDPEAPIFEIADIGLVGDLFEVIPELTKRLG
jgi:electron transfer flavoprotein alpha subunit